MSANAGLHLIARYVGPSIALLGIAGFSMLSWVTAINCHEGAGEPWDVAARGPVAFDKKHNGPVLDA